MAMSVNRLNLARTKDHGPSLSAAVVLSQECGCPVLPVSVGRADGDSAATIVELIQLGGRATRIGVIIPLLEVGGSDAASGHDWYPKRMAVVVCFTKKSDSAKQNGR